MSSRDCVEPRIKKDVSDSKNIERSSTIEEAGEDCAYLTGTVRDLIKLSHEEVCQEKVLSLGQYKELGITKDETASKKTEMCERLERQMEVFASLKDPEEVFIDPSHEVSSQEPIIATVMEASHEAWQRTVITSEECHEPTIIKGTNALSNTGMGDTIERAEETFMEPTGESWQMKVLSSGKWDESMIKKGQIPWTNTNVGDMLERVEEDHAPSTGSAKTSIEPLHKENLQEKVLSSEQYKEHISSKKTKMGETFEKQKEVVADLTHSEKLYVEPTHEVGWQENVLSVGKCEVPMIIQGKTAWENLGIDETIERAEEGLAPFTGTAKVLTEPLHKANLQLSLIHI